MSKITGTKWEFRWSPKDRDAGFFHEDGSGFWITGSLAERLFADIQAAMAPIPTSGAVEVAAELYGVFANEADGFVSTPQTHAQATAIIQQYGDTLVLEAQKKMLPRGWLDRVVAEALATQPPAADGKLREALERAVALLEECDEYIMGYILNYPEDEAPEGIIIEIRSAVNDFIALAQPASGGGDE